MHFRPYGDACNSHIISHISIAESGIPFVLNSVEVDREFSFCHSAHLVRAIISAKSQPPAFMSHGVMYVRVYLRSDMTINRELWYLSVYSITSHVKWENKRENNSNERSNKRLCRE